MIPTVTGVPVVDLTLAALLVGFGWAIGASVAHALMSLTRRRPPP